MIEAFRMGCASAARLMPRVMLATAMVLMMLVAAGGVSAQSTTVIVVRHAETVGGSSDPVLSDAGAERARKLAAALKYADVAAIYTTQYQRTRLTGAALADSAGIIAVAMPAANPMQAHVDAVAAKVKEHAGKTVVIVGHSNTVPLIIRALGGPDVGPIPETEYDNFFTLVMDTTGVRLVRSRY